MTLFFNRDLNRLLAHTTLHTLAWCFCGLFSAVFLLRVGLAAAEIFLVFAAILTLRLALRPLVLVAGGGPGLWPSPGLGKWRFAREIPMLGFVARVRRVVVA